MYGFCAPGDHCKWMGTPSLSLIYIYTQIPTRGTDTHQQCWGQLELVWGKVPKLLRLKKNEKCTLEGGQKVTERGEIYISVSIYHVPYLCPYLLSIYPIYSSTYLSCIHLASLLSMYPSSIYHVCLSIYVVVSHSVMSDSLRPYGL